LSKYYKKRVREIANHTFALNDLVHVTRGFYKGQAGRIISKSLNSVSIKSSQGIVTVNVGDVAAGSSPIPIPPAENVYPFKPGQTVRVNRRTSQHDGKSAIYLGPDPDYSAIARVRLAMSPYTIVTFYFSDLVEVPEVTAKPKEAPFLSTTSRVEGKQIHFDDVKIGDTITSTRTYKSGDVETSVIHTGVVSKRGFSGLYTSDSNCINPRGTETLTLVKAAVEKDELLETLKSFQSNTVLVFSTSVTFSYTAVKTGQSWILTASSGSTRTITSGKLREIIGNRKYTKVN